MNNQKTNLAVSRTTYWDVNGYVHGAAHQAVFRVVYWDVHDAVHDAANRAVEGAVWGAVDDAVHRDPDHPALQDFLLVVWES